MVVHWQHAEAEIEIETRNNNNNILSTLLSPRGSLNLKLKREMMRGNKKLRSARCLPLTAPGMQTATHE